MCKSNRWSYTYCDTYCIYIQVFVNFVDHGGGKIVEFPNGPYLHAKDLVAALGTMREKKMYGKMMFYMEACNGT